MSFLRDINDWAELHEFSSGRCPRCHKRIWVEGGCVPECHHCGYAGEEDRDDYEHHDDERDTLANLGMCEADFR